MWDKENERAGGTRHDLCYYTFVCSIIKTQESQPEYSIRGLEMSTTNAIDVTVPALEKVADILS